MFLFGYLPLFRVINVMKIYGNFKIFLYKMPIGQLSVLPLLHVAKFKLTIRVDKVEKRLYQN